jgi:hypothetical protein
MFWKILGIIIIIALDAGAIYLIWFWGALLFYGFTQTRLDLGLIFWFLAFILAVIAVWGVTGLVRNKGRTAFYLLIAPILGAVLATAIFFYVSGYGSRIIETGHF